MSNLYNNHSYLSAIFKHKELPILMTEEFSFWRCVQFDVGFYSRTVSELFHGNLRESIKSNRYSELFPNQKLSYWEDSPKTSRQEIKKHGVTNNIITFWAYDDLTSTIPTLSNKGSLIIVDGIQFGFEYILEKYDNGIPLSKKDKDYITRINLEKPDCIAYKSFTNSNSTNFLFFEKGFNKLSLREVNLRLGDLVGKNTNTIVCAYSSDYTPSLDSYGYYFSPIAKTKINPDYIKSEEFKSRTKYLEESYEKLRNFREN